MLKIGLLGRFRLSGDEDSRLPKKAEALLAYLAMHQGRSVPRDQLADLLWGDSKSEQARHSLRQALAAIRRALNAEVRDLIDTPGADVLLPTSDKVAVDALRFE